MDGVFFDLPVSYGGTQLLFPSQLLQLGYTHKFLVDVYGTEVAFEQDEEGAYRAIVDPDALPRGVDLSLFEAIAHGIEEVLK